MGILAWQFLPDDVDLAATIDAWARGVADDSPEAPVRDAWIILRARHGADTPL